MSDQRRLANCIRALAIDAVQMANSGHPGMPLGMADIAQVLWQHFLRHNPQNPGWFNRDRFVLSNGHGCMLLYALLHLTGYDLSIEDLRQFRQLHSKTPGHPEQGHTPGVEATTGPLGQGLAMAVGMAIAERELASTFNRDGFKLIDHYTYVFAGDGCLMEGVSHEACSLAGTLALKKLIVFWDNNGISIDGAVSPWFNENVSKRFEAYGWNTLAVDGHDPEAIFKAVTGARTSDRPTLIDCRTVIGFGSPNWGGTAKVHGNPFTEAEAALTKAQLGWTAAPFQIATELYAAWDARAAGKKREVEWQDLFARYQQRYPELAAALLRRQEGRLPNEWVEHCSRLFTVAQNSTKAAATRKSSQQCIEHFAPLLPEILGGSADLTESNCTQWPLATVLTATASGNYLHYGVREFGMSAILNGLALHRGFLPFGGTFLTFSDYAKPAIRLSALMKQRVIYIYSHDSIGLGEDGPTHQPIEHIAMLRLIPNVEVWRPADFAETAVAWQQAIERTAGPSALLLTRQNLPQQQHPTEQFVDIARGAYIVHDATPVEGIFIATGSEVSVAVEAALQMQQQGIGIRVVSMPCVERFKAQSAAYKEQVLPAAVRARVAIEAGRPEGWREFVGDHGAVIGLTDYGVSAPYQQIYALFGFTAEKINATMRPLL